MTSQSTVGMLRAMKMGAMAGELERQLTDSTYRELGFEERLGLLVTADLLEIAEARCGQNPGKSMILCTQYETDGWYKRINPDPDSDNPISEAIMDRIIHNAFDVMIERWFRSLKTELIYINEYRSPKELRAAIRGYIDDYNSLRPHEALDYATPDEVYRACFSTTGAA